MDTKCIYLFIYCQASAAGDATWLQTKRTACGRSGEGDVDSRIQVEDWTKMETAAQNRTELKMQKSGQ